MRTRCSCSSLCARDCGETRLHSSSLVKSQLESRRINNLQEQLHSIAILSTAHSSHLTRPLSSCRVADIRATTYETHLGIDTKCTQLRTKEYLRNGLLDLKHTTQFYTPSTLPSSTSLHPHNAENSPNKSPRPKQRSKTFPKDKTPRHQERMETMASSYQSDQGHSREIRS